MNNHGCVDNAINPTEPHGEQDFWIDSQSFIPRHFDFYTIFFLRVCSGPETV